MLILWPPLPISPIITLGIWQPSTVLSLWICFFLDAIYIHYIILFFCLVFSTLHNNTLKVHHKMARFLSFYGSIIFHLLLGKYPGGSEGEESACKAGDAGEVDSTSVRKIPGRAGNHQIFLPKESQGQRNPWGHKP